MTTIDTLRTVFNDPAATLEDLKGAAEVARTLAATSAAEVTTLNERRPAVLLQGSDKDLAKLDDAIAMAIRTAERAGALATGCDTRAAEVRAISDEQRRRARYERAGKTSAGIAATMPEKYRRLVDLAHEILVDIGEARHQVGAANRDLPEGAAALPDPEAFRTRLSRATIVSKEAMTLWCREDGTPVAPEWQADIVSLGNGEGARSGTLASSADHERFVRKACWRVKVQPAVSLPVLRPFDLDLVIPPLFTGEAYGWRQDDRYVAPIDVQLATLRDHEPPRASAPIEELIAADGLDDFKRRHRVA